MPEAQTLLDVQHLNVKFSDNTVVDDVSFTIKRGEVLALLGESGSGKTMTAMSIMRLLPPNSQILKDSVIRFAGENLLTLSEVNMHRIRGGKIGMVFQEPMTALNPVFKIGTQIAEILRRHLHLHGKKLRQRVLELLHEVGLPNSPQEYHRYPHQLSGGMRQRVVIAMAIAAQPDLLIADEATSALDVFTQAQILNLLKDLQAKTGMAMLFITHDLSIAKKIADRIIVLQNGKIVESEETHEFFLHPHHEYSAQLIRAAEASTHAPIHHTIQTTAQPLLKLDDVKVHFPIQKGLFKRTVGWVKAVDGVSFKLYPGQTVAVVGESGSGKTTLARAVLQLVRPTAGVVDFQTQNLNKLSNRQLQPLRRDMQIVFQDPFSSLDPRMLVGDIIAEGLVAQKLVKSETQKQARIDELLQQVGLSVASKHRYPHEFSGGQRQRISIARALAVKPKLIVCDEPTSALDVPTQIQILNLLQQLQTDFELSYLFITHNIPVAAAMADEICVMYQGKIVEHGTTEKVIKHPQHPYTKALLDAVL